VFDPDTDGDPSSQSAQLSESAARPISHLRNFGKSQTTTENVIELHSF
jgi:hypothetical protein